MSIRIQIALEDDGGKDGPQIAYQAFPEENATTDEVITSNMIIAFCGLLSNASFIEMVAPYINHELRTMKEEQDAATKGSAKVM